jgi:ABC-type multidrug transport system ATPase subunit
MKQRIKFALALQNKPEILYLDEPGTNLDNEGLQTVKTIIKEHIDNGGATIIASNDTRETDFCNSELQISDYKK